jgi:hypothetical protein
MQSANRGRGIRFHLGDYARVAQNRFWEVLATFRKDGRQSFLCPITERLPVIQPRSATCGLEFQFSSLITVER